MTPYVRIITSAILAPALFSCSPHQAETSGVPQGNPYGAASPTAQTAAPAQPAATAAQPANPIYDTPAAYEDNAITPADPNAITPAPAAANPAHTAAAPAPAPAPAPPPANGAAIIHTVVKGDTLSGIAAKYKVPTASIKQANRMTNDTVILGRKMVIPPN